jgi:hypothetical protein
MEPFALFRIPGNKNNLVNHPFKRINEPLDKCPAMVREKIFFLAVGTPCLTTNQYHCRSHVQTPFIKMTPGQINREQDGPYRAESAPGRKFIFLPFVILFFPLQAMTP